MEEKTIKSVGRFYLLGATWIVYALVFPLYRMIDYFLALVASMAVFFLAGLILPKKKIIIEKDKIELTEDDKLNAMIREANNYISQMRKADLEIPSETVSKKIDDIEKLTAKIFEYVKGKPQLTGDVRRFINYYLPTSVKLMTTYAQLEKQKIAASNIAETMAKKEEMLDKINEAFEKQLNLLFSDEALDISTDITVMENILSSEGLLGKSIQDEIKL